jgi:hypothetical protein
VRSRPSLVIIPAIALVVALAGCDQAGNQPIDDGDTPPPSVGNADAPVLVIADSDPSAAGISVADALGHQAADDLVVVTGALFVDPDGTVLLCDAIAESFPPQCGGARIEVEGLDLGSLDLEEANGVRWAEGVVVFGSVE